MALILERAPWLCHIMANNVTPEGMHVTGRDSMAGQEAESREGSLPCSSSFRLAAVCENCTNPR